MSSTKETPALTVSWLLKNRTYSRAREHTFLDMWPRQRKMEPRAEGTEHLAETGPHPTVPQAPDKLYPTSDPAQSQRQRPLIGHLGATPTLLFCLQREPLALFSNSTGERLRNQARIKVSFPALEFRGTSLRSIKATQPTAVLNPGASRKARGLNSQYLIICFIAHYLSRQVWEGMIWMISPQGSTMNPPALVQPC